MSLSVRAFLARSARRFPYQYVHIFRISFRFFSSGDGNRRCFVFVEEPCVLCILPLWWHVFLFRGIASFRVVIICARRLYRLYRCFGLICRMRAKPPPEVTAGVTARVNSCKKKLEMPRHCLDAVNEPHDKMLPKARQWPMPISARRPLKIFIYFTPTA